MLTFCGWKNIDNYQGNNFNQISLLVLITNLRNDFPDGGPEALRGEIAHNHKVGKYKRYILEPCLLNSFSLQPY